MLDTQRFKETILFTLKHHGTKTQGEDYRLGQVADKIVQLTLDAISVNSTIQEMNTESQVSFTVK